MIAWLGSFCVKVALEKIMVNIEWYPFKIWTGTKAAFEKIDSTRNE